MGADGAEIPRLDPQGFPSSSNIEIIVLVVTFASQDLCLEGGFPEAKGLTKINLSNL